MRWASLLVLSLAVLPWSSAAILRVDAACTAVHPNGATWQTAFSNVQSAVRAAAPGDEIWVAQGIYTESLILDAPLSLYGGFRGTETAREERRPGTQVAVLDGGYAGPVVVAWNGATIDGFTITGGWAIADAPSGTAGGAVCAPSGSLTVSHCVVVLNYALDWYGGHSSAGGICAGGAAEIAWNDFVANEGDGVAAVYCTGSARIHNNTFRDNRAAGAGAILCTGPSTVIHDNTLTGNAGADGQAVISGGLFANNTVASGVGPGLTVTGAGATVAGNLITGNFAGVRVDPDGAPVAFRCNDVVGNFDADYVGIDDPTGRDGNIRQAPLFTKGAGPILHLSADSPCRDAGDDSVVGADWRDADGEARRMGRHVDIGADERSAAPPGAAVRVSPRGSDSADGLTWATARRTLPAALDIAFAGNEVWLTAGDYGSGAAASAAVVRAGVGVYGGFSGTEAARGQRRPDAGPTTLHDPVAFAAGAGRDTILDGVTMRAARSAPPALACAGASPTVSSVSFLGAPVLVGSGAAPRFTGCAFGPGDVTGGVTVRDADLSLAGCDFQNDPGIVAERSQLSAEECSFGRAPSPAVRAAGSRVSLARCNVVWRDAGVQADAGSRLAVSRCTFAALAHDALSIAGGSSAEVRSSLFHTNARAAAVVDASSLAMVNATVARNGGAAGCIRSLGASQVSLVNTIVALNASGVAGPATLRKCYVAANGPVMAGTMSGDPRFAAPEFGDFHLQPNSPCRDAGDASAVAPGETDLDGAPRVQGARVDVGACESNGAPRAAALHVIRVRPGGSDAADGSSWGRARKTIAAAIEACPPTGAEIWVAAGVYREAGLALRPGLRLLGGFAGWETVSSLRAPARNLTVVEASGSGTIVDAPPEVSRLAVLDGFAFRGSARATAVSCAGAATITHNVFTGAGTAIDVSGPAVVANNVFVANAGSGGTTRPRLPSDVLSVTADAVVANNTVAANEGGVALLAGAPRFENNIVARNGEGVRVGPGCVPLLRANCVFGNAAYAYQGTPDPTGRGGNFAADPQFVDFPRGDIHIQPGSPCANSGLDAAIATDTDIDGQPRRTRGRVDMGADETDTGPFRQPVPKAIRVRPGGDDRNDGSTWAKAKRTLSAAVSAAAGTGTAAGADVWAAAGVYPESLTLPPFVAVYGGFRGAEYALGQRRPEEAVTIIRPAPGAPAVQFRSARAPCTLDGFAIEGQDAALPVRPTGVPAFSGVVHSIDASPGLVRCDIRGGGFAAAGGAPRVIACRVDGQVACAEGSPFVASSSLGGGAALYDARSTFSSNAISGSSGSGLYVFNGAAWITNNTIAANARGVLLRGSARVTLANNAVVFNGSGLSADATVSLDARTNNLFGNAGDGSPGISGSSGNISVDPLLMDVMHNDLRPRIGSPLVDAGDAAFVSPGATDVAGLPRLAGASVDIGAYEADGRPPRPMRPVVVRVSPAGSDVADGSSWRKAMRTLQAGLDAVRQAGGGEVWAASGLYSGPVVLGPFVSLHGGFAGSEADISERSPASRGTVIDAARAGCAVTALYGFRSSVVDGCTLRNGTGRYVQGAWGPGAADLGAAVFTGNTVSGCYGYYNASLRAWSGVAGVRSSRGGLITDNVIASNYGVGVWAGSVCEVRRNRILGNTADSGAGLTVSGAGALVDSNVFTGNSAAYAGGALLVDDRSVGTRCVNNTIVANYASSAGAAAILSPATVANNIIIWNQSGVYAPTALLTHNNVWDNGQNYQGGPDPTGQDGNLSEDPLFVNAPDGDYRLLPDSPCLDAGLDAAVPAGAVDIAGSPRILGLHVDMGAYER